MANPNIPPPPDGSGIAQQAQPQQASASAIPPPPDGSGIAPGAPTASMGATNPHSLFKDSDHNPASNPIAGMFQGAGEGVFSTISGLTDLAHRHLGMPESATVHDTLADLAGKGSVKSTANDIGYGGETLMEFLSGDEALKGLSMPEKLAQLGSSWKILENSPKLLKTLQLGAAAVKAGGALSPEEAALVAKYPKIAKLVGLGVEAVHAGATQAAQTTARTGDISQGVQEGAETGLATGVMGAATHGLATLAGKGARGAAAADALRARAAEATPTALQTGAKAEDLLNAAHAGVTGTAQNALNDATSTVHMFGEGAPATKNISKAATAMTAAKKAALSADYQAGEDKLVDMLKDADGKPVVEPYVGSPLHQVVQEIQSGGVAKSGALDKIIGSTPPGSDKMNGLLDRLSKAGAPEEAGAEKPGAGSILSEFIKPEAPDAETAEATGEAGAGEEGEEPDTSNDLNAQQLIRYRRALRAMQRTTSPLSSNGKADRQILGKLVQGIDDTIGKMADGAEPQYDDEGIEMPTDARAHLDAMNSAYKQGIQPFKNRDVQAILKGNLNDVSKRLLSGNTSLDDIDAARKVVGDDGIKSLGGATLQRMVADHVDQATGEVDYKKLFKTFQKINPEVRKAYFGETGDALSKALTTATQASGTLDEVGKNIKDILGNGDFEQLAADPKRLQRFSDAVGPAGMKTMGQTLLEQKLGESALTGTVDSATGLAKKGEVDPEKLIGFWHSFDKYPELREQLFAPDAESKKAYGSFMKQVGDMASTKKLVKYGILPVTLGTAGVVHSPLAALIAATVGLGGGLASDQFGSAKSILDHIANHPATWKTLKVINTVAKAADTPGLRKGIASVGTTLGNDDKNNTDEQQSVMSDATANLGGSDASVNP